tara:strand:- start:2276 stop:2791 length:516 start_codon:yes stop_codon:yes gene_type:complete
MKINLEINTVERQFFFLIGQVDEDEIFQNLIQEIKNNVSDLSYKTNIRGNFTGFNHLNKNESFIKFINLIKPQIKFIHDHPFFISAAWGHSLKKGEEVLSHTHVGVTGFSGILYLSDSDSGTFFSDIKKNVIGKKGRFILFSPFLHHLVPKLEKDETRYAIAFNAESVKNW